MSLKSYHENPEYREKTKQRSKEYYQKVKNTKKYKDRKREYNKKYMPVLVERNRKRFNLIASKSQKKKYHERKRQMLCPNCGAIPEAKTLCRRCLINAKKAFAKYYLKKKLLSSNNSKHKGL